MDSLPYDRTFSYRYPPVCGPDFYFFGLMKNLKLKPVAYVRVLIGFENLNILLQKYGFYFHYIMNYQNPGYYLAAFTGLFWGTSELSSFPFFPGFFTLSWDIYLQNI